MKEKPPAASSAAQATAEPFRKIEEALRVVVEGVKDYAIFFLDPGGRIVTWNEGAERIKGYKPHEIIGQHFSRFYTDEDRAANKPGRELEIAGQKSRVEDEGWRVRKDGSLFWASVVITALYDDDHRLQGFLKITRDLTERKNHEEMLRQSEERFRLLVERVKDYAIFLLDPEGHIASWNAGAAHIKGYKTDEIIGQHFSRFYTDEDRAEKKPARELEIARKEGRVEDEGWRVRKDGSLFWANVIITALYDNEGTLRGFAKVTRDMTERKRFEEMVEAGRHVNEFLAMLAHELRNPLAPIRNAVSVMQLRGGNDPDQQWSRDLIDRQLTHLTRLVDDLLDISRVTSGQINVQRELLELADVAVRAVESSRPFIEAQNHRLEVLLSGERLLVEGDLIRLSQVLVNLLNNAAKYTPQGGHIRLSLAQEGKEAVVRVRDDGVGMAPSLLTKAFDLFVQGRRTLDRAEGGLGIGLSLVKRLVEVHGGTVQALSDGVGKGSEFVVRLPLALQPAIARSRKIRDDGSPAVTPRRVLVVDDNVDSAESMAMLIRLWGHEVHSAHDASAALKLAAEHRPEVVLLDIGLPVMNGYELARKLRELPDCKKATLVAMTGYGQEEHRRRAFDGGFDRHLVKPIATDELRELLA